MVRTQYHIDRDKKIVKELRTGLTYKEAAKKFGVCPQRIGIIAKKNGYKPGRSAVKTTYYELRCNNCEGLFWRVSRHRSQKFCSRKCMGAFMKKYMKKDNARRYKNGKKFYPCVGIKGEGGEWKNKRIGRLVMEEKLGRRLVSSESVHHIDGNSENNNIENLQVLSNSKHVSMTNKDKWATIKKSTMVNLVKTKRMTKKEFANIS
jgi:hypothetical protein